MTIDSSETDSLFVDRILELGPHDRIVVIDEIQRLSELLDGVDRLIEERRVRFLRTALRARKLRRRGVNRLGGRKFLNALWSGEFH